MTLFVSDVPNRIKLEYPKSLGLTSLSEIVRGKRVAEAEPATSTHPRQWNAGLRMLPVMDCLRFHKCKRAPSRMLSILVLQRRASSRLPAGCILSRPRCCPRRTSVMAFLVVAAMVFPLTVIETGLLGLNSGCRIKVDVEHAKIRFFYVYLIHSRKFCVDTCTVSRV